MGSERFCVSLLLRVLLQHKWRNVLRSRFWLALFIGMAALYAAMAVSAESQSYVSLKRKAFQKEVDGKHVDLFTIRNSHGMSVSITNYGARIEQILVRDRRGRLGDVALGYESIDQVISGQGSMGAFIGRYANRIANAEFSLDGVVYKLTGNSHGGLKGSRFRVFDAIQISPGAVQMTLLFHDGEEGFPGDMPLRVVYRVTESNELVIDYDAVALTRASVFNFTNHTFFNLSGVAGSSILAHRLLLNADQVLDVDPDLVPTGGLRRVQGTPMDFRKAKAVGRDIDQDYDLLRYGKGYDHHYVINRTASGDLVLNARLTDPRSGRVMEVWSTEPGLQLFTANSLAGKVPRDIGKGGVAYGARSAICLEPSHFPDSPNHSEFPTTVLRPGQWYNGKIVYRFSVEG
jgi:aldose 1-epimerase